MRYSTLLLTVCCSLHLAIAQNVGINATGAAPAAPAMLDVDATNRGMLIPRVALTAANNNAPIGATIVNSLLVFNTATSGVGVDQVTPGYYYWDAGAGRWTRLASDADAWRTLGNAGTDATLNFLGTIDAVDLRIRTNNLERFEIISGTGGATGTGGRLRAYQSGTAAAPIYSWNTSTGMGLFRQADNVLGFSTGGAERVRMPNAYQLLAMGDGTEAAPFYSWNIDPDIGLYRIGANILGFSTAGLERMRIIANGNVGINGAPAATAQLDVQATNRGILIPRVALVAANNNAPVGGGVQNSMLVYNTATAGAGINAVSPGYYYWSTATARWRRMVDVISDVWISPPIDIAPLQTIVYTVNIPGVNIFTGASVVLSGNWAASPTVVIEHVEARTGAVRFRVYNYNLFTTYLGMDFIITTTRY